MTTILVHENGRTSVAPSVDPRWLAPGAPVVFWVNLDRPTPEEAEILRSVFAFHELAIEDALSALQYPRIESYDGLLYLILHGIDYRNGGGRFTTHDIDFFLGPNYLVTVHGEGTRTINHLLDIAPRNDRILSEGASALLHRIVDGMVDRYEPEIDKLEESLDEVEAEVFATPGHDIVRRILELKRDVGSLRRVIMPQRDVIGRLARREFSAVDTELAYRFRDVHDHLVRYSDEALLFQDRITALLEAHLSNVSNRLNRVMKVLTIIATIFMPLTVISGIYGMNVPLPAFPGGPGLQFWWIIGLMIVVAGSMVGWFTRRHWM